MITMEVLIKVERIKLNKGEKKIVTTFVQRVLKDHSQQGEVSILFTDNKGMEELNKRYRHIPSPTDVLSFPQQIPDLLGDIAISLEMAQKRSQDEGISPLEALLFLVLHGLLHLLGYDHGEEGEAQRMQEQEDLYRKNYILGEER